jgi:N-acetylglucosaminyl-diphospho-decaprenol L-rhamnosyltransferase
VGVISGCFLLAETELWRKLGGFDERYFMYGEDADLARRAIAMGHYPLLCPNACLLHEWGRSSGTPVHKALLLFRGKASLVRAHWQGAARHIALLFLVTGVGLRYLLTMPFSAGRSGAHERWSALWRARWEWIRGYDV